MTKENKTGLSCSQIQDILSITNTYSNITEVILYGSDLDLSLKGDNLDLQTVNLIHNSLDDLDSPYEYDVAAFESIENEDLRESINRVVVSLSSLV
jgi:uncharacterized protein